VKEIKQREKDLRELLEVGVYLINAHNQLMHIYVL